MRSLIQQSSSSSFARPPFPPPILQDEATASTLFEDLVCTVCYEIPYFDPVITPCEHVFCRGCINETLSRPPRRCPNDRTPLNRADIKPLSGVLRRVWEKIHVKCPHVNCDWVGTMGSYLSHAVSDNCKSDEQSKLSEKEVIEMKNHVSALQMNQWNLEETCVGKDKTIEILRGVLKEVQIAYMAEKRKKSIVEFDNSYKYGSDRVVELTQLICKYLEDPPSQIDRDRIFACIRDRYIEYTMRYENNPEHYGIDVRMLLNVCLASTWFTDMQRDDISEWCDESFSAY